jgi:hypothetical protein
MTTHNSCAFHLGDSEQLREMADAIALETQKLEVLSLSADEKTSHLAKFVLSLNAEKRHALLVKDMQIKNMVNNVGELLERNPKATLYDSIRSLYQVNTNYGKGARFSVEAVKNAKQGQYASKFATELSNIKEFDDLGNAIWQVGAKDINLGTEKGRAMNNDIIKALAKKQGLEVTGELDPTAVKIADAIYTSKDYMYKNSGRDIKASHFSQQTHNQKLLREADFKKWYDAIKDKIDFDRQPFMKDSKIAEDVFKHLLDNQSLLNKREVPPIFKKSLNEFEKSRNFAFKGIEDHIFYENNFGSNISEIQKFYFDIEKTSRNYAFETVIGKESKSIFENSLNYLKSEKYHTGQDGNKIERKILSEVEIKKLRDLESEIRGLNKVASEDFARGASDLRKIINSTLYGRVWFTTPIGDRITRGVLNALSQDGSLLANIGINTVRGVFGSFKDIFETGTRGTAKAFLNKGKLTNAQKKQLENFGIAGNTLVGNFQRFTDFLNSDLELKAKGNKVSSFVDATNRFFTKLGYLDTFDEVTTRGVITQDANIIFKSTAKSWETLGKTKQRFLKYGIGEEEFNLLKEASKYIETDGLQGKELFTPDAVLSLSNAEIQNYAQKEIDKALKVSNLSGKALTQEDIVRIYEKTKINLADKLRTMYNTEAHIILGKPDSRKNNFTRGTEAGTIGGELARFFLQAKTYPILYYENVVQNILRNPELSKVNKGVALASVSLLGAVIGGTWAYFSSSILSGKEPELVTKLLDGTATTEENLELAKQMLLRGGVFGVYGDAVAETGIGQAVGNILASVSNATLNTDFEIDKIDKRAKASDILSFLSGPALSKVGGLATETVNYATDFITDGADANTGLMLQNVKNNLPAQNTIFLNALLSIGLELASDDYGDKQERSDTRADRANFFNLTAKEIKKMF